MKRTIAALIAGLVIGGTGTAVAQSQLWEGFGKGYSCSGVRDGFQCKFRTWEVGAVPSYVYMRRRNPGEKWTYTCQKAKGPSGCFQATTN